MTRLLLVAVPCSLLLGCGAADPPIDQTYTEVGRIVGNETGQTLTVRITGASFKAPFTHDFTVVDSSGEVLFHENASASGWDKNFADEGFVAGCSGYEACKRKWYFEDIPARLKQYVTPARLPLFTDEEVFKVNIEPTAREDLQVKGRSKEEIDRAIAEMHDTLSRPGYFMMGSIGAPEGGDGDAMIWVRAVASFVSCYRD